MYTRRVCHWNVVAFSRLDPDIKPTRFRFPVVGEDAQVDAPCEEPHPAWTSDWNYKAK